MIHAMKQFGCGNRDFFHYPIDEIPNGTGLTGDPVN
jgi:hypothetical protein